ncbi:MAG TPA: segregation/condensation protein A, partial [Planctomycetota bacterium]|nr:segregation/condensation protein A [Planctomycetota bacterium]
MAATLEFRTTLENFTGPLDLLLYLIRKDEIDILAIPIAQVLEQYEQFVRFLADIDVNLAADYLVMATTLMEIKSRMLLPPAPGAEDEEELEDPRAELVKQLLEYRTYKERALDLARKLEEQARRYKRTTTELPFPLDHVELGRL